MIVVSMDFFAYFYYSFVVMCVWFAFQYSNRNKNETEKTNPKNLYR